MSFVGLLDKSDFDRHVSTPGPEERKGRGSVRVTPVGLGWVVGPLGLLTRLLTPTLPLPSEARPLSLLYLSYFTRVG